MSRFTGNCILRGTVAAVLVLCIALSGGCISITIREKPTQPTEQATQAEVITAQEVTFPSQPYADSVSDGLISASDVPATETQFEIDWDNMTVTEQDPNVLTEEEFAELAEQNPQMADLMELVGPYIDLFGFAYDAEQDIFYSTKNPVQRIFGYNTIYDAGASRFGMYYLTQRVRFDYAGKEWMVQLWKGQYGVTVGGEVGIYYRDANNLLKHFEAVADEDLVMMGFQLCKNSQPYLERGPERHWWLTGFRILDVAVPTQLSMIIYFDWEKEDMAAAFEQGLNDMLLTDITYIRDGTRFWLTWTL